MRIVITGAEGFIARNLAVRLRELGHTEVVGITRATSPGEFASGNAGLTQMLCESLRGRATPVAFSSSTQAELDNPYGLSKRAAEQALLQHAQQNGAPVYLFRLTNVFGKWARPHYNSAVATFCHNIARQQPITVNDPASPLRLVYVDDVVEAFVRLLDGTQPGGFVAASPVYETTVGQVADTIRGFAASRESLLTDRVGTGLVRALYSTYISHLPPEAFAYQVPRHEDPRGAFVEMLKTPDCGQFSYFTAHPGVTRGEHYHHTKTEKFLVIRGTAEFAFRHIGSGQTHALVTRGGEGTIVETVPGWTHNITNVGDDELIVMLWANEIFDRARPDTVAMKVRP
jgi:UDP-2-acetamido-2,6-beta-L-arabino-hexul-4-ose reductase